MATKTEELVVLVTREDLNEINRVHAVVKPCPSCSKETIYVGPRRVDEIKRSKTKSVPVRCRNCRRTVRVRMSADMRY